MKIVTLMENTKGSEDVAFEHGLSFYVETKKHRLLMDTGASDLTWENAKKLGIDLTQIDTVILSHGHYDHCGGLMGFASQNEKADIYIRNTAFLPFYHDERYIGIDPKIAQLKNVRMLAGNERIDEELSLFTQITGRRLWPNGNLLLSQKVDGKLVQDSFDHEQCLVVREGEKTVLISGCAHNGILNILDQFFAFYLCIPDVVISGFHMMKKTDYTKEEIENIQETARELKQLPSIFYTGHCTGQPAFDLMKEIMGDQLLQIHSGDMIQI